MIENKWLADQPGHAVISGNLGEHTWQTPEKLSISAKKIHAVIMRAHLLQIQPQKFSLSMPTWGHLCTACYP